MTVPTAFVPANERVARRLDLFVRLSGATGIVVGLLVLAGYGLRQPILTMLHPSLQAMSVLTATEIGLIGGALVAERLGWRGAARTFGAVVLAGSIAVLLCHAWAGEDLLGPVLAERLFAYDPEMAGRTSIATAVGLFLVSFSFQVGGRAGIGRVTPGNVSAILGAGIGGLALIGYAYGVRDLYAFGPFDTIALHTAAALFVLGLAAVVVRFDRGWGAVVASNLAGGGATRRQLGLTLMIPVAGGILLRATDADTVGPGMAMALLVSLTVASLGILILRDGRVQDELDRERRSRNDVLSDAKAELERDLAMRSAALEAATRERIQVEDTLRQAQKMEAIGQLTGGVAHDFNNLLTVIRSSSELLRRPDLPEERRLRYVDAIADTAARATKLTGQLLAFARRQALKPEVFDVGQSVTAIADMVGSLTGNGIAIVVRAPDEPCFVDADPSQFDTAIVNLAVNARDAMAGRGELSVEVAATGGANAGDPGVVTVSVMDDGCGIPPGDLQRIFEPFFTTKEVGHGTGLGLSQVFGFAKQSGGEIRVTSQPGEGTTFILTLPRVAGMSRAGVVEADPEAAIDGHGMCILVVEDNADVGSFTTGALGELGYRTVWAANAEAALAELRIDAVRFDVVFSDVVMPGMNGIELGQEIRRLHEDLPVVLTSGYSHVLAQNGTYGFELLHKPYSVDELARTLRKAATWRRRKRILAG
ncbi:ATP-binding protein [Methylobacterium sp. J-068]|uniref:hybrid sensor histidine kinase/response regulator n=1 Tax=Methylobacterium sp. J-068 TaxID=2836649 RepID=UPI001FB8C966|nr:ATP-binding protein [Methylobacterium sp. J-068]MCJ2036146.1 ATP-binding protein [Methylobacterium sp. J-068]